MPKREALAARHRAQAVAHLDAVDAARAAHRTLAVGEDDGFAGGGGDGGGARLVRGRCSAKISSPPSWSRPGSESGTTTCSGKASSP